MAVNRCACIDVGSNTTALLVADIADGELSPVGTRRRFTMLGADSGPTGISEAKLAETTDAVEELIGYAQSLDCEEIELVATHVVREAHNGHELESRILERTSMRLEVIDGHEEARFSFIGATGGLGRVTTTTVVIDAGGGSTEISICEPGREPVTASFAIGSGTLQQSFLIGDPPAPHELTKAREYADELFSQLDLPQNCGLALAVGGGASTAQQLTGGVIDASGIGRVLGLVMNTPSADLAEEHALAPNRARLLPGGLVILAALIERLGTGLEVGRGGLREGLLIDRYGG
jgi:exopolyphosphatase/guanosine-5'-triphosphate,3'-diphosphate pyrophosphatase